MSDKNEIVISDAVKAIAAAAKKQMTIGEGGVVEVPKDFYESLLPEGVTVATVKAVQAADRNILAGTALALGEIGLAGFKKDKKLESVTLSAKAVNNKFNLKCDRTRTSRNPADGSEIVKHAVISASVQVAGTGSGGEFGRVKQFVAAQGAKMLA